MHKNMVTTLGKESPSYFTEKKCAGNYKWSKESRKINHGQDTPKQPFLTTKLKSFPA